MEYEGELFNSYMSTILIGDTNTGKNRVLDRIRDFFDKGIIASGQACSEAGLIGGLFNHIFSLGLIPTNDGGLVALDEDHSSLWRIKQKLSPMQREDDNPINFYYRTPGPWSTRRRTPRTAVPLARRWSPCS